MPRFSLLHLALPLAALVAIAGGASAQTAPERLPVDVFDVAAPSQRVDGALSRMRVTTRSCQVAAPVDLRRRIVDIALQEWAFFGFPVLDRLNGARLLPGAGMRAGRVVFENTTRRAPTPSAREGSRVAATIAGYWAVTPEGPGIVEAQTRRWARRGPGTRWTAPWSAAFISWVMCEGGLSERDQFRRAIAHWTYIDQAIQARDRRAAATGFTAFEIGEQPVEPGDLLCSGSRPRYANLAERRAQMGEGARSHCDIVVQVEADQERILAVGGNVLRAVSLKVLPARRMGHGAVWTRGPSVYVDTVIIRGIEPARKHPAVQQSEVLRMRLKFDGGLLTRCPLIVYGDRSMFDAELEIPSPLDNGESICLRPNNSPRLRPSCRRARPPRAPTTPTRAARPLR